MSKTPVFLVMGLLLSFAACGGKGLQPVEQGSDIDDAGLISSFGTLAGNNVALNDTVNLQLRLAPGVTSASVTIPQDAIAGTNTFILNPANPTWSQSFVPLRTGRILIEANASGPAGSSRRQIALSSRPTCSVQQTRPMNALPGNFEINAIINGRFEFATITGPTIEALALGGGSGFSGNQVVNAVGSPANYVLKVYGPDGTSSECPGSSTYVPVPSNATLTINNTEGEVMLPVTSNATINWSCTGATTADFRVNGVTVSTALSGMHPINNLTANVAASVRCTNGGGSTDKSGSIRATGKWFQETAGARCATTCPGRGFANRASPEGAFCTSGEARPASAQGVISYAQTGCFRNCDPQANDVVNGATGDGDFCYRVGQEKDDDGTDRTVGCFCGP